MDFELEAMMSSEQIFFSLETKLLNLVNEVFPQKTILIRQEYDQSYLNEELKKPKKLRQREYCKHGKSEKYLKLRELFNLKLKGELKKYKERLLNEVEEGKRGSIYPALKKLGMRPGVHPNS